MPRVPSSRWSARLAAVVATVAVVTSACGSSDSSSTDTSGPEPTAATTTPDTTSAPETTSAATTVPETTTPQTTTPETTTPQTTAPETTAPATTTPVTAAPVTSVPQVSDEELAQFCFDSEQVYIADVVASGIDGVPDQARAAIEFFQHSVDLAVESAPPGFGAEPLAAQAATDELVALLEQYEYDVDALLGGPDSARAVELTDTINAVMDELTPFLTEVCRSVFRVLDSQGTKLSAVIADAATWPPLAVTNVTGDIRLLVPPEWTDWLGTAGDATEMTFLQASPDNERFDASWDIPGVMASVHYVELGVADPTTRLGDTNAPTECEAAATEPEPYADAVYTGSLYLYESCSGSGAAAAVLLATDEARTVEIVLEFQFPDGLDRELLDQMLATFAAGT